LYKTAELGESDENEPSGSWILVVISVIIVGCVIVNCNPELSILKKSPELDTLSTIATTGNGIPESPPPRYCACPTILERIV